MALFSTTNTAAPRASEQGTAKDETTIGSHQGTTTLSALSRAEHDTHHLEWLYFPSTFTPDSMPPPPPFSVEPKH
ncbi:uncharacterized protein ARMOST_13990 [Armillaria ostoyae]|uniref:Uncharacterized protein n=1 Tax=Armillaria ostoyae TaxID=47428 RepID=A0A284RPB0_ARMOS|nr:uncharacterized protein ARMOST_13990 [Armillaria ostoyae]